MEIVGNAIKTSIVYRGK